MIKRLPVGFASPTILLAVGLIVGIGVTFAYFQFKSKPAPQPQPATTTQVTSTPVPITQSTPIPDISLDWNTYTNATYKFSFKYDKQKHGSVGESSNPNPGELLYLNVQIHGPVFNLVVSSKDKQFVITSIKSECDEFIEVKQTRINGETADELVCRNTATKEKYSNWFFSKFGYTYWMNGEEQIGQTFKFL